jgi:hypothetical protein
MDGAVAAEASDESVDGTRNDAIECYALTMSSLTVTVFAPQAGAADVLQHATPCEQSFLGAINALDVLPETLRQHIHAEQPC